MIKTKNKLILAFCCLVFAFCTLFFVLGFNGKNIYAEGHVHDFVFETSTGKITAVCQRDDCTLPDKKVEVSFSCEGGVFREGKRWSLSFNGKQQFEQEVGSSLSISYTLDGKEWNDISRAGEYVVTVSVEGVSASITFNIEKSPTVLPIEYETTSPTSIGGKDGEIFVKVPIHIEISSEGRDGKYINPGDVRDGKITIKGLKSGTYFIRTRERVNYLPSEPIEVVVPVHEHVYDREIESEKYAKVVPTCVEYGEYYKSCICGEYEEGNTAETFIGNNIDSTNHNFDEGVLRTEPKIGIEGEKVYTCLDCGFEREESIPALKGEVKIKNDDLMIGLDGGYEQDVVLSSQIFENYDIKEAIKSGELEFDYTSILDKGEYVVNAYTLKLFKSNDGVNTEIKFDDIKGESKLNIKIAVPEEIDYKEMKVVVLNGEGKAEIYTKNGEKFSFEYNDGYVSLSVDSIKEIALVGMMHTRLYIAIIIIGVLFSIAAIIGLFVKKGKRRYRRFLIVAFSVTAFTAILLGLIGFMVFGSKISAISGIGTLVLSIATGLIYYFFGPLKRKNK